MNFKEQEGPMSYYYSLSHYYSYSTLKYSNKSSSEFVKHSVLVWFHMNSDSTVREVPSVRFGGDVLPYVISTWVSGNSR